MARKIKRFAITAIAFVWACLFLAACGMADGSYDGNESPADIPEFVGAGDTFSEIEERDFVSATESPQSAFAVSTFSSSYTYMRRAVQEGRLPAANSVRIEEYINYFDYDVAPPEEGDFSYASNVFDCPWNGAHKLMRVTFRARDVVRESAANNLVFLADVSASMYGADRIGLLQKAVSVITDGLGENDVVSLVTYAGESKTVFEGKTAADRTDILQEINALTVGGKTAGQNAISRAYAVARRYFIPGGNNRIILFTDGDFNVGATDTDALRALVEQNAQSGIMLSCAGVGYGNYKDKTLEAIATAGNGEAYYFDGESEVRRVFGEKLTGTLFTVARDGKAQISFDSSQVQQYRLLGYDNRMLTGIQFEDPATDAGEIGSGKQITALYEIVPAVSYEENMPVARAELRYKSAQSNAACAVDVLISAAQESDDDAFIACVAEYGLLLRRSRYAQGASFGSLRVRLNAMQLSDSYKQEFRGLVNLAA